MTVSETARHSVWTKSSSYPTIRRCCSALGSPQGRDIGLLPQVSYGRKNVQLRLLGISICVMLVPVFHIVYYLWE